MVERMSGKLIQVCSMSIFPSLGKQTKILQDVVLSMTPDPGTVLAPSAIS